MRRGVWQHPQQRPSQLNYGLRAQPWWSTETYGFVGKLLRHFDVLRDEGLMLLRQAAFDNYLSPALVAGNWTDVTLRLSGSVQPGARRAPRTARLLEALGGEIDTMVSGAAYFSVLSPGARLRPHCGPTNIRLRVHVGLSVPDGNVGMRVGDEVRTWREGGALVFDDSFEHEVWNEGGEPRLVFILDAWHPDLRTEQQRHDALEPSGQRRYAELLRRRAAGLGPPEEGDLVGERRARKVF